MIEFGGFITVEDAERIRKLEIIAQKYFENNVDDEIPPGSWKDYMTPQEAKAKGMSVKDDSDWPDDFDLAGNVVEVLEEEESSNPEPKRGSRRKSKPDRGKAIDKKPAPMEEDDDSDLFEDNSELKAVIKIYYKESVQAPIPYWVYSESINPKKRKAMPDHLLVVIESDDFLDD